MSIIHELRQDLHELQDQKGKSIEHYKEMQSKYQQMEQEHKESMIISNIEMESVDVNVINQTLALNGLREELERKKVELGQARENVPRLVEEKIEEFKVKYQEARGRLERINVQDDQKYLEIQEKLKERRSHGLSYSPSALSPTPSSE